MIEYIISDVTLFGIYIYVSTWICFQEGYVMSDKRFYRELEQGVKGLMLQLPLSNVAMSTILPYTKLSTTFSLKACVEYIVAVDFLLFFLHYMLHSNKYVYKKIHMEHHKTIYVVPFSATILTFNEMIVTGLIPTLLPLFFIDIDFIGWTLINIFVLIHGLFIHSTYKLPYEPFLLGSQNHAIHHMKKTVNYGFLLPIWDKLIRSETLKIPRAHIRQRVHRYYENKGKHL